MYLKLVNKDGSIEDTCSFASYVENNKDDGDALDLFCRAISAFHTLGNKGRTSFGDGVAHAWLNMGAGGVAGLLVVDGDLPDPPAPEPSPALSTKSLQQVIEIAREAGWTGVPTDALRELRALLDAAGVPA